MNRIVRLSLGCAGLVCAGLACAAPLAEPAQTSAAAQVSATAQAPALASEAAPFWALADAAFEGKEWARAETAYAHGLALEPQSTRAWLRIGHCRLSLSKYPEAIEAFSKIDSGPARAVARYNIACALALQGKSAAAFDALDVALRAGFKDANALANDPDLLSLRADARFAVLLERARNSSSKPFVPPLEASQFDFWIGEWNVTTPTGAQAGTSRIEKSLNGCVVIEHWSNSSGNKGISLNRFDPATGQWRQHWIDDTGGETYYVGSFAEGCMAFSFEERAADGKLSRHRMRFFDLGDGSVRQWGEVSADAGETWNTEFDLLYRRSDESR